MEGSGAPFTEEILRYSVDEFPFLQHVRGHILGADLVSSAPALEQLHNFPGFQQGNTSAKGVSLGGESGFQETYRRFVRDVLRPHLGEEFVIYESRPGLRIHLSGGPGLTPPHIDGDHGHTPWEVNFWLPMTRAHGSATLWTESAPGQGDFHPLVVDYGTAVRFYGNRCLHYSTDNNEENTRISFDCRLVRLRDFFRSGIPVTLSGSSGCRKTSRWTLFGYYEVMGPDGVVGPQEWDALLSSGAAGSLDHPCAGPPVHPWPEDFEVGPAPRRQRSPSEEHRQRCAARHGSQRAAQRACARCAWLRSRGRLLEKLAYTDVHGASVPWVAESDADLSWALGCKVCRAARKSGFCAEVPRTAYSDFSFGAGSGGLVIEALVRHGGNGRTRWDGKGSTTAEDLLGRGHAAALSLISCAASQSDRE